MLLKELNSLAKQPVQEAIAAEIKNDSYVKITSGEHKHKTGYVNKLIKSKGEVTAFEVEIDDEDNEYVKCTPDQVKVIRESLNEAKQYEESSDFDADFNTVEKHLKDAKDIVKSSAWQKHMKDTDANFDTSVVEMSRRAMDKLQLAIEAFDAFYEHIQEAS
jgi:hypothetical protein